MSVIEISDLVKEYDDVRALDGLSLSVDEGVVYGLLGPNGAGKSTLISILLGYNKPTSGSVTVLGRDMQEHSKEVRRRIGVLPEGFAVYGRLTARQHIDIAAESKGVEADSDALLDRVGLTDAADRRTAGFSKGMQQRLALATALVGEPDLLILDEPTTGLDPNGARELRSIVREENERGATVFFSSHILSQVEAVCDTVGVVQNGALVVQDTIKGLREDRVGGGQIQATVRTPVGDIEDAVGAVNGVNSVELTGETVTIRCAGAVKFEALRAIEDEGATIVDIKSEDQSLDSIFAEITVNEEPESDNDAVDNIDNDGDTE